MCQKSTKAASMVRFVVVLAVFLSVAECAAGRYEIKKSRGSCLNYGHACWGGHGKRSSRQEVLSRLIDNEALPNRAKAEWFLSKIISPLDLRYYRDGNDLDTSGNQPGIDDLFTDVEGENAKSGREWDKVRNLLKNSNNVAAIGRGRNIDKFPKSPEVLEKRSTEE
ncbi:uncharacterized protein CCHa1 isoform X1 [Euwallacea similis]|uniref:uncharacterized protein CCHa1 isoform X1 n=1 Tax=Euwallacea similis TaxID=1736056 RepID=UPI00344E6D3C